MSIVVLRGSNLEIKLGLVFFIKPPLKLSPNEKILPSFKRGYNYGNQLTNLGTIILWFFGKLCNLRQCCHNYMSMWKVCTTTNTCPTKNSSRRCLGYVVFECSAKFQFNWSSFAHRDQQEKYIFVFWYDAPKPRRCQMSSKCLWTSSIKNQLRAHSHIWVNPKITNFIESKLSTWQDRANMNMNRVVETIQTSSKLVWKGSMNCS